MIFVSHLSADGLKLRHSDMSQFEKVSRWWKRNLNLNLLVTNVLVFYLQSLMGFVQLLRGKAFFKKRKETKRKTSRCSFL